MRLVRRVALRKNVFPIQFDREAGLIKKKRHPKIGERSSMNMQRSLTSLVAPHLFRMLLLSAVCPAQSTALGQEDPAHDAIRIQVATDAVIARTDESFVGFGYETSAVANQGYFSPQSTHLAQLLRTLSPHGLIRIGGNISDWARFAPNGTPLVMAQNSATIFNGSELEDLGGFLKTTGWKVMWGLNLKTGTREEAVAEAVAVQKALGNYLQSFEIGNETDLQPAFKRHPHAYWAAYRDYKVAIRAVLPDAPFSGPDAAWGVEWLQDFAKAESGDVKLLTRHYYRGGAGGAEATIPILLKTDSHLEQELATLQKISSDTRVPIRFNEINSFFGGGKKGVSDTFASALWCLDTMLMLAAHGCDGVNMETDINQNAKISDYSPIYREEATGRLIVRPEYYGMLAFSIAGVGDLLKTSVSKTEVNVKAYATKNSKGELWVTVVNKDLSKPAKVELAVPASYSMSDCFRLTAPSVESRDQVTLAGAEVSAEGTWKPAQTEAVPVKNGNTHFKVPATSAALIRLR